MANRAKQKKAKPELSACWSCRNAVPDKFGNGCSWSRDLIPVFGWRAEHNPKTDSWRVISCPEYAQDPPEMIRPDFDTDTDAADRLRTAIVKQAAVDYDSAIRREARETKNDALERQLWRLYGGAYYRLFKYRRIPWEIIDLERFFVSDYAGFLFEGDPDYLMTEIRRQNKAEYSLIATRKHSEELYRKGE